MEFIHVGTTCDTADDVGGHYYNSTYTNGSDPWSTTYWYSDSEGNSSTTFVIDSGYMLSDNVDHALVVHDNDTRVSCGVLKSTATSESKKDKDNTMLVIVIVCGTVVVVLMIIGIAKVTNNRKGGDNTEASNPVSAAGGTDGGTDGNTLEIVRQGSRSSAHAF